MYIEITTGMAVLGALYVASNRALAANIIWSVSNPALIAHNILIGQFEQAIMFTAFSMVSIYGILHLTRVEGAVWHDIDEWKLFSKRGRENKGGVISVQDEGGLHQLVCQSGGTGWLVEDKKLDEKIKRGREIRHKCPYIAMCGNLPSQCAGVYPGCQDEWKHLVNNDD